MKLKIEKEPGALKDFTVDPAFYSIHLESYIRFVERDKSERKHLVRENDENIIR